ncbi:MAG: hypothetical protein ACE5H2_03480 [Terriglobia bacterium]
MRTRILFFLAALLLASPAHAKDFWKEKDYRRWSKKECLKLLRNSPWTKQKTFSTVHIDPVAAAEPTTGEIGPQGFPQAGRERQANPRTTYQVQLRSALPVRQAIVRLTQINQKYDKMSPQEQQAFDQRAEQFLAVRFPEIVVVHVSYGTTVTDDDRELARHWQSQTTETLRNFVFLMGARRIKVPLLGYAVAEGAGREFQLVFPRQSEGQPLLGPQDKSLKLEFNHPNIRGQGEKRVFIEWKVKKMRMDETVIY